MVFRVGESQRTTQRHGNKRNTQVRVAELSGPGTRARGVRGTPEHSLWQPPRAAVEGSSGRPHFLTGLEGDDRALRPGV